MKKTVEEKAELAKLKIDKKLQKQQKKEEKVAAKKEAASEKKELKKQQKAAKKEVASAKKETKKELNAQKKAAKKEAAEQKKKAKQEAKDKIKALKNEAKQAKAPSKEKPQKAEKAAKKEKKEKKKSKEKTKPAKKAKQQEGEEGEEKQVAEVKSGGISTKKKLFIGVLALIFVSSGVVGFLHFRGGAKEESDDPYMEAYVLDDDFVTSITAFLGESETRDLPEVSIEENGGSKKIIYDYTELEGAAQEVRDYVNFLTDEQQFVPMFDYNLDAPGGYLSVGTASQEEGKILKLDIDYTDNDYKVMVSKSDEKLPKPKEKVENEETSSRDGALGYLSGFTTEELGLEKPVEEYKAIYDNGQFSIGDYNCYGISLYELGSAGTNVFVSKFFIPIGQNGLYRYDPAQDTYIKIEKPPTKTLKANIPEVTTASAEGDTANTEGDSTSKEDTKDEDSSSNDKDDTKEEEQQDDEEQSDKKESKNKIQKGRKGDRQQETEQSEEETEE